MNKRVAGRCNFNVKEEGLIVGQSRMFKRSSCKRFTTGLGLLDWDSNLARTSLGLRKPEDTKVIFYQ